MEIGESIVDESICSNGWRELPSSVWLFSVIPGGIKKGDGKNILTGARGSEVMCSKKMLLSADN